MPLYDYRCTKCGKTFEKLVRSSDTPAVPCETPDCEGLAKQADVNVLRRFGSHANACSVRFHFNFPSDCQRRFKRAAFSPVLTLLGAPASTPRQATADPCSDLRRSAATWAV